MNKENQIRDNIKDRIPVTYSFTTKVICDHSGKSCRRIMRTGTAKMIFDCMGKEKPDIKKLKSAFDELKAHPTP